jgi:hypothetical protein
MKTLPPLLAKTLAIPLPIPLLDPVTMTDRSAIDVSIFLSATFDEHTVSVN